MDKPIQVAKFVNEIMVKDPDTNGKVELSVFKHENGGMFAIDSSYIVQCLDDNIEFGIGGDPAIPDPLQPDGIVILKGT